MVAMAFEREFMERSNIEALAVPISEACRALGLGRSKLYDLIASKQLKAIKIGKRRLVPMTALREFVASKANEAA